MHVGRRRRTSLNKLSDADQLLREQRLEELNRKLLINDFEIGTFESTFEGCLRGSCININTRIHNAQSWVLDPWNFFTLTFTRNHSPCRTRCLHANFRVAGDPDIRPPSPLPIYDRDGNRTNTREIRMKAAMTNEQQKLIEHMIATVPGYVAPTEFRAQKRVRRLLIPQDEFPEYNFMGLIIGPRGVNHKRLESESGAQISIRGKGTQKEGKRSDHQTDEEANMPQHVHIAADTDEKLQKAVSLIEPLLDPSHPIHEEFKKKGLEQLAMVNGMGGNFIARNDAVCTVCGQMGHYGFDCPETRFETYDHADVVSKEIASVVCVCVGIDAWKHLSAVLHVFAMAAAMSLVW